LYFQDGTYQIDSNSAVVRSLSNFTVKSSGRAHITQAPNRTSLPNNTAGDLFIIADCTDFTVDSLTFDGLRDTVSPMTPVTASASSGQPSVTVASGQGANYVPGQHVTIFGGTGTSEQTQYEGTWAVGAGITALTILSITPGGGSGGGDQVTFTTNLAHSYAQVSGTALSDGYGPYAYTGAYITCYEVATANPVAGRTLGGEDQQNGLHCISCQKFTISRVTARNLWESPIKLGNGFNTSFATDGCQHGTVTECTGYHAYDQGVSVWVSQNITVKGCVEDATGWAGISLTGSDHCTVTGNRLVNQVYRVPNDVGSGTNFAIEGGLHNLVKGNICLGAYSDSLRLSGSPLWIVQSSGVPSLNGFLAAQTAAGTSVVVSSTTNLVNGGKYALYDGPRTEAVTVTVVDATHVTFAENTLFSHASGVLFGQRVCQENVIEGNYLSGSGGNGIASNGHVRTLIRGNVIRNWSLGTGQGGNGLVLVYFQETNGGYIGGDGSQVEGNIFAGGNKSGISVDSVDDVVIRGNKIYGLWSGSNQPSINIAGTRNTRIEGNFVSDNEQRGGIFLGNGTKSGSVVCSKVIISGNTVTRLAKQGINVTTGDSLIISGNTITSCGTTGGGIDLLGVANSVISNNICNSNQGAGIKVENNGSSVGCTNNRFIGNTCRDDGTGLNITNGGTWTQQYGIQETGNSDFNLYAGNELDANGNTQIALVGTHSRQRDNIISGVIVEGTNPVLTPSFANGTAAQLSDTGRTYMVYLEVGTAGTAFTVAIGPTSTPANTVVASGVATSGEVVTVRLPAGWYLQWTATTATLASQIAIGA
jgi:parallel beta-helix repeat protein